MRARLTVPQVLQELGRCVFTTREVAAFRDASPASTTQVLRRMERDGLIVRAARGIWCVPTDPRFTPHVLVPFLSGSHRAYVSFFSALNLHGVIEQIPQVVYAATTGQPRRTTTPVGAFSFHRIAPSFFDGFEWYGDARRFLVASPEKALVDCLYVSGRRGRRFGFLPELDPGFRFDLDRAAAWVDRIPDLRLRNHVRMKWNAFRERLECGDAVHDAVPRRSAARACCPSRANPRDL